jgi:para-nitrobenzyl esterase
MKFRPHVAIAVAGLLIGLGTERRMLGAREALARVELGVVEGVAAADGTVRVFKGIPFAAPPVGSFRWRAPQPPGIWNGVRKADAFAPSCEQPARTGAAARLLTSQRLGDVAEDCLYLNIWTAAKSPNAQLPVVVWFPGGGFATGGGSALVFDGEALATKGIVVVTTNYRLGVFGFFALPELTREANGQPTGNFGLMDQTAALQWVHRNIAAFGGNPNRVTIFGQSAGATSVMYQMAMPSAKGLFQRAIGESSGGTGGVFALDPVPTLEEAEQTGVNIARSVGAASLIELRAVPATRLLPASQDGERRPMIDGRLVIAAPDVIFARGQQNDVPLLAGSNADDGNNTQRNFSDAYIRDFPNSSLKDANVDAMAWRVRRWVDLQVKIGRSKAYLYYFTRRAPSGAPAASAYHGAELPYVFANLHLFNQQWSDWDRELERIVSAYWIDFATKGDPNRSGLPRWSAYDRSENDRVMVLGDQVGPGRSRISEAQATWFDAYRARLQSD